MGPGGLRGFGSGAFGTSQGGSFVTPEIKERRSHAVTSQRPQILVVVWACLALKTQIAGGGHMPLSDEESLRSEDEAPGCSSSKFLPLLG